MGIQLCTKPTIAIKSYIGIYVYVSIYINAFTPNIKSMLNENLGGILGGTQC